MYRTKRAESTRNKSERRAASPLFLFHGKFSNLRSPGKKIGDRLFGVSAKARWHLAYFRGCVSLSRRKRERELRYATIALRNGDLTFVHMVSANITSRMRRIMDVKLSKCHCAERRDATVLVFFQGSLYSHRDVMSCKKLRNSLVKN